MRRWDWGQIVAPAFYILLIAILAVFAHTGLQGSHGLAALNKAERLEQELTAELDTVTAERREMRNLVRRLHTDYLDLDLLDERARSQLGYVRRDELVIR